MPDVDTHFLEAFGRQAPYAWVSPGDPPAATGRIRAVPDDFVVVEELGFEPAGEGEHLLVSVTKREKNTVEAAHWLSSISGASVRDIGYCGLKDRHAVTTQWFSVPGDAKIAAKLQDREATGFRVNSLEPHNRKLRRGIHQTNRFELRVLGIVDTHSSELQERLDRIRSRGVPNYFGPQRFGPDGDNVRAALEMVLSGRPPKRRGTRGILLSSLRSTLFNQVLSRRVEDDTWDSFLVGDVAALTGSRSHFQISSDDSSIADRLRDGDIHPTGPMWGEGDSETSGIAREIEISVLEPAGMIRRALESAGLKQERRALRVLPTNLTWSFEQPDELQINFGLPPGSYATAVLREIVMVNGDTRPWGPETAC